MDQQECKHEACHCSGSEINQEGYCSDACRDGRSDGSGSCACGHPGCK